MELRVRMTRTLLTGILLPSPAKCVRQQISCDMKELFRERDLTTVSYYQSLLEQAGIATFLKNEHVSTQEGVSIPEYFPALWILNDSDYDSASEIIRGHMAQSAKTIVTEVNCGSCGEKSPSNFDTCWSCQSPLV